MRLLGAIFISFFLGFVQISEATKTSARPRAFEACEKALITLGLWDPPVRARIHSPPPFYVRDQEVRVGNRDGSDYVRFNRTGRNQRELRKQGIFPLEKISIASLVGKRVLDLACGDGDFVEQMRQNGIDIEGLDVFLNKYQKSRPYYVQAGADDTGYPDSTFDVIITSQGPLSYYDDRPELQVAILMEARRILKSSGRLLISPIYRKPLEPGAYREFDLDNLTPEAMLAETPFASLPAGLRITDHAKRHWMMYAPEHRSENQGFYWMEIQRD